MNPILIAVLVVCAIGILCAVMLVIAAKLFAVKEDEKYEALRACMPGANCGACGYAGCDGYAKALAGEEGIKTNLCVPGADAVAVQIAQILGVEAEDVVEKVAVVQCCGDCDHTSKKAEYAGIESCAAAKMLYGGSGMCTFGCIGLGDCVHVCPNDAVCIEKGIAHIDPRKCVGCGLCAKACPNGLIAILPDVERVIVSCHNTDKGASVRRMCSNGCIGCKMCEKNCPSGAITVVNNLAQIDYSRCTRCNLCAERCPVGCILISDLSGMHRLPREEKM